MYQQFDATLNGNVGMKISCHTESSHSQLCNDLGIMKDYEAAIKQGGSVGGDSAAESANHLLTRYLNSASRTQTILCVEESACEDIQMELFFQLSSGHIHIIDIAAGHGAGTVSLINTICEMRQSGILKTEALNVTIHAIDYSNISLGYYEAIIKNLIPQYLSNGIVVNLQCQEVDLTSDEDVRNSIAAIKDKVGQDPRYLLICSAISGVSQSVFREQFSNSYEHISNSFRAENSSFLWVDPRTKKQWMPRYWREFFDAKGIDPDAETPLAPILHQQEFSWIDPYLNVIIPSAFADYLLVKLA